MSAIKLSKLPDRTPVKIVIAVLPELNQMLAEYAECYRETYGVAESVADLVPHMLSAFLANDRVFMRSRMVPATRDGAAS